MKKNPEAICYIQNQLKNFNPKFVKCVERCFNRVCEIEEDNGCFSNTVALYVCAKEFGYNPQICYGLCSFNDKEFYHVWLEIDGVVIDISIYGNINYSPFSLFDFCLQTPYIGNYEDSFVKYGKFVFDEDFPSSLIYSYVNLTVEQYIDYCPVKNAMWNLICEYFGENPTPNLLNHFRTIIKGDSINEKN